MSDEGGAKSWAGTTVVVLGLARQGKALARYLTERGATVIVSDLKTDEQLSDSMDELADLEIQYALGGHPPEILEGADLLCLSGGVPADLPLAQQARRQGIPLSNDSHLFLDACPATVVGITGSAGKTTTTELLGRMARAYFEGSDRAVWVGGNIGRPLIVHVDDIHPKDLAVLELSSFQLELMTRSPQVSALLNLTPNHLDRHRTMENYIAAKVRILDFQSEDSVAVLGRDDPGAWEQRHRVRGRTLAFGAEPHEIEGTYLESGWIRLRLDGEERKLFPAERIELRGPHNVLNVLAACALAAACGISAEAMEAGLRGFSGVTHRLEFVRRFNGADWYNDSIATAPERTLAALRSFHEPLVLLAGGRDKGLPWDELLQEVCQRVDHLVLFGEAAPMIADRLESVRVGKRPFSVDITPGLEGAIAAAASSAEEGDVVLLAPGGTSFDEFEDFAARGARFKELVGAL